MPYWLFSTIQRTGRSQTPARLRDSWKVANIGGAVAHEAEHDVVGATILLGEGNAGSERQVTADDGVATPEVGFDVDQVHRAALALADAGRFAKHFGHHLARFGADSQRVGVVTIGRDDVVPFLAGGDGADCHGFLPDVQVEKAADFSLLIELGRALFKQANQHHLPVPVK
jgi:hypothetical protein